MDTAPDVIQHYYAASAAGDTDALVACFTPDAEVADQEEHFSGHDGIRAWRTGLASAFTYTQEITGIETIAPDEVVVTTHVEGNFPGGVVDLTNRFAISDGLITSLRI
jgi:ketosteroid isomerase-like protein